MTSIAELYALQEVDLALDADRTALVDVESRLGESEELLEARQTSTEMRDALRVAEKEFKEQEWNADELRGKIEPLERRLYAGKVQNPKELEDLQQEINSLKRRRSDLEDKALEAMEKLDGAQQSMTEAERNLEELTSTGDTEQRELHTRQASLQENIGALEDQRGGEAARIGDRLLGLYDRLRDLRQGKAVAKVVGGACQGCRISLPINLIQRARGGEDTVQCSSCERILYVG